MALVFIPTQLRHLTGGDEQVRLEGGTVKEIVDALEQRFPGIRERFVDGGALRPNLAVSVDGEISPVGLLEPVATDSEVHFIAAIRGGAR